MNLLPEEDLETLSRETGVRGAVVRKALERYAVANVEQKQLIQQALQLLLEKLKLDQENSCDPT